MIDLRKFFTNPFKDKEISFTELLKYAARHLQLMIANDPGSLLNERINATTVALAAVEAGVTDVATKAAIQKGKTDRKKTFREALAEKIRRIHGAVVAAYGDPSTDLTECFPQGREVFSSCRDEQLNNKLSQLVTCLTPRAAQVGQIHVDNAGGLLSTWTTISAEQDAAMAQKSMMAGSRDTPKAQLQLALYLNVLRLAMLFPDQPEKCDLYCPQQFLKNAQAGEEEEPTPPGP